MNSKEKNFKEIFNSNKDRVFRICCSYVHSDHNREDLFQEIFSNVWKNLDYFREESHINTWIYRISINTAINFCKLQSKTAKRCQEIKEDILSEEEKHLHHKLFQEKQIEKMFSTINKLPIHEKTIISLVLEGLSHAEIADVCGLTEGNVRIKFHRIKKKLKQMMEEQ